MPSSGPHLCRHRLLIIMLTDSVLQEPHRRVVAQRTVATTPVVEHLDLLEQIGLCRSASHVDRAVHPRVLQAVEEALGGCVVPAVAFAANQGGHAVFNQPGAHGLTGVLAAAVAVEDHVCLGLASEPAIVNASVTMSALIRGLIDQPTISRLNRPSIMVKYSQPSPVWMSVISPVHTRFGAAGVMLRASRFGATGSECRASVVALKRRWWRARMPCSRTRPLNSAQADVLASALLFAVQASRAIGGLHFGVDALHQDHGLRVRQARTLRLPTTALGAQ